MTEPRYEIVPVGWVESPLTEMAQAPSPDPAGGRDPGCCLTG
jgi:hypothetical protein